MEIPAQPLGPIWLRPQAGHGETVPGIVLGWNRDHIHSALDSGWILTVASIPFDGALMIDHSHAERMIPVRDATPLASTDDQATQGVPGPRRRRRHVWIDGADQTLTPGLIVEWRRSETGWEALVATPGGQGGGALIQWRDSATMRPLTDDGWMPQPR